MALRSRIPNMLGIRPMLLALLLAVIAGISACGSAAATSSATPVTAPGRVPPTWSLEWDRTRAPSANYATAQAAFSAAAQILHRPDNTLSKPSATYWLASGPRFGFAVVALDPAGAYQDIAILTPDPTIGDAWRLSALGPNPFTPCAQGTATTSGTIPLGETCGLGTGGSLQAPAYTLGYWTTPTASHYLALRIRATATRPTSATTLTLATGPAWSTRQGSYTSIVLPLPHGQTLVLASTAPAAQIQRLAAQASAKPNAFIPIPSTLPIPPGTP